MPGPALSKAWVTFIKSEKEETKAFLLARSLRQTRTTGRLIAICTKEGAEYDRLKRDFDAVIIGDKTFAKKSLALVAKCILIDPNLLAIKNPDGLFDLENFVVEDANGVKLLEVLTPDGDNAKVLKNELVLSYGDNDGDLSESSCGAVFIHLKGGKVGAASPLGNAVSQLITNLEATPPELHPPVNHTPIAIIGMACRFPGANNYQEYWDLILNKRDAVGHPPKERWPAANFPDTPQHQREVVAGFLNHPIDEADSEFFRMSPFEMRQTDPHRRLLLEVIWEALEDSGVNPLSLKGTPTGLYTGSWLTCYKDGITEATPTSDLDVFRTYLGNGIGATAGRIAQFLGTTGPTVASESGCSSSMVAVGLAVKALRQGDIDLAIVGGVNLFSTPFEYKMYEKFACSPDGISKTFDASANGYGRGEGCGSIVLRRLPDAAARGDRVHALIRGYGQAQEGMSKSLGTPTVQVQAQALSQALEDSGVCPSKVSYIEAHGTGTAVGDPIEIQGIAKAYSSPKREDPIWITSHKPNIGHLESCSGIAGIIKTVMALKNKTIPPHIRLSKLNPGIDLDLIPARIPNNPIPWGSGPRFAGVSNFGITGTDTHLILEEASNHFPEIRGLLRPELPQNIVTFAAVSEPALDALIASYKNLGLSLGDVAFTANTGRASTLSPWRGALIASDFEEARNKLEAGDFLKATFEHQKTPKLCFLFGGIGSQYPGMGKELYETFSTYRKAVDGVAATLRDKKGVCLKQILWGCGPLTEEEEKYVNLAIFAVEHAMTELLAEFGINPDVVLGHSVGEYGAAAAAGVIDAKDAVQPDVLDRHQNITSGQMLSLKADKATVDALIQELSEASGGVTSLDICCWNTPTQLVVGGVPKAIAELEELCAKKGIKTKIIHESLAYHSRLMEPSVPEFREVLKGVTCKRPKATTYISSTKGAILEEIEGEYWVENLVKTVRFLEACTALATPTLGVKVCLEISPHPILSAMVGANLEMMTCVRTQDRNKGQLVTFLEALGALHVAGFDINWGKFHANFKGSLVPLPHYPWQRKKYWFEGGNKKMRRSGRGHHPYLGAKISLASSSTFDIFEGIISQETEAYLGDHRLGSYTIFPGAGYIEMFLAVADARGRGSGTPTVLKDFKIRTPLDITRESPTTQTVVETDGEMSIFAKVTDNATEWVCLATGKVSTEEHPIKPHPLDLPTGASGWEGPVEASGFYAAMHQKGYDFGASFRSISTIWRRGSSELLLLVDTPPGLDRFHCHPILIDAMIQSSIVAEYVSTGTLKGFRVPVFLRSLALFSKPGAGGGVADSRFYVHTHLDNLGASAVLYNGKGEAIASLEGLECPETTISSIERALATERKLLVFETQWEESKEDVASLAPTIEGVGQKKWIFVTKESDAFTKKLTDHLGSDVEICDALNEEEEFGDDLGGVAFCWGMFPSEVGVAEKFLNFIKTFVKKERSSEVKLLILTEGALGGGCGETLTPPTSGILWGMARTLRSEYPALKVTSVDLPVDVDIDAKVAQVLEVMSNGEEHVEEIGRSGRRPVYSQIDLDLLPPLTFPQEESLHLELPATKDIASLKIVGNPAPLQAPPPRRNVVVKVKAASLNFKDLLSILKPTEEFDNVNVIGMDWAGVVERVGPEAGGRFKEGDAVMGVKLKDNLLANFHCVPDDHVIPVPREWTFEQASTLPVAFATVYHCLVEVGKLKKGETILIHTASGGVGLVAIQVANFIGARIIATAGTERKRAFLNRVVGVADVLKSRDLEFAQEIMRLTGGRGVDMVLNSLTGSGFKEASLSTCAKGCGSRFVEMSKLNIWSKEDVANVQNRPDVGYDIVDISAASDEDIARFMKALEEWVCQGRVHPLPYTRFEYVSIRTALGYFQDAKHVSKVVVSMPELRKEGARVSFNQDLFNDRSTYLITGGLGGLGIWAAKWMVENGAKYILLMGRNPPKEGVKKEISNLQRGGASVVDVVLGDVSKEEDCVAIFDHISNNKEFPPLRGIIHAAGVLADAILSNQSSSAFERALKPKVDGAWNLHKLTLERGVNLEHFVMFSSVAAVFGHSGQGNYAAANAYLDALAHYRDSLGLPATTVNWGQWGQVGMAVDIEIKGYFPFSPKQGFDTLRALMASNLWRQALVFSGDLQYLVERHPWTSKRFLKALLHTGSREHDHAPKKKVEIMSEATFWEEFKTKKGGGPSEVVESLLATALNYVLKAKDDDDNAMKAKQHVTFTDMGLDSLMKIELKNTLQTGVGKGVPLSVEDIDAHDTPFKLIERILEIIDNTHNSK